VLKTRWRKLQLGAGTARVAANPVDGLRAVAAQTRTCAVGDLRTAVSGCAGGPGVGGLPSRVNRERSSSAPTGIVSAGTRLPRVPDPVPDAYAAAFDARCAAAEGPGTRRVDGLGIHGLVPVDGESPTQLLVMDDRAFDVLSAVLPLASGGTVRVHDAAERCAELIRRDRTWMPKAVTGMVCRDLRTVPEPPLPPGLTLHPVCRVAGDPPDGVPLTDAVAAAGRAATAGEVSTAALVTYLRSLPGCPRLFAAVDDDGMVRGTSGSRTFCSEAYVFFVNTDPGWRRRGVGLSMTAAALRSAVKSGATRASLDASGPGIPLYRRLGFTAVAQITQFSRSG
jgi:GNAT superfamily N-acetyltransferase